jgi:serine-type D-Ala-D-Ala carboxypeptidase/endopeptidase (penicillin-binding protein 4)
MPRPDLSASLFRGAATLMVALVTACSATAAPEVSPSAVPTAEVSPASTTSPASGPLPSSTPSPEARPTPTIEVDRVTTSWTRAIDAAARGHDVSIAVGVDDRIVYGRAGRVGRIPASVQKVLTSMAALATFGPHHRFPTTAATAARPRDGVVRGELWLVGGGDPELGAARIAQLATRIAGAGVDEIRGSVIGDTTAFSRRWWAPGWVEGLSRGYVARPTALAYEGNRGTVPPERAAASALTTALERAGVRVTGRPSTGQAPEGLRTIAAVDSAPLRELLARQNHGSLNLHAEVVLRAIGAVGGAGTTADGAGAVEAWAASHGARVRVRDGSGLSHGDRVGAVELTWLLLRAREERWGAAFEASLPRGGSGTLGRRLIEVPVRAKTGTLFSTPVSSLAGYATDVDGDPIAFTVLSHGSTKTAAAALEDSIVRILTSHDVGR